MIGDSFVALPRPVRGGGSHAEPDLTVGVCGIRVDMDMGWVGEFLSFLCEDRVLKGSLGSAGTVAAACQTQLLQW